jgi:arylsulfatase A-like enzyme
LLRDTPACYFKAECTELELCHAVTEEQTKEGRLRPSIRIILLLAVGLSLSCGEPEGPHNVLIIGVDTLRPDHLGCYGYTRPTSPNLDELAASGVVCENAVSQSPWTTPSFGTAFTSLYPTQHGAGSLETGLRTESTTLAELLQEKGYATGAIVSSPSMSPEFGLNRGFGVYDICYQHEGRPATEATALALEWLDGNKGNRFFLFVHYFDPHLSYRPPPPYDTMFDPDYQGEIGNYFTRQMYPRDTDGGFSTMKALSTADWNHIKSLYDGEIAFTDFAIGQLLDGLASRGLDDNTLVVFISDHGEEFFEHGGFRHGHTLFNELIRVPLVFKLPGVLPGRARVRRQVRILDVMPTVLDLLGIEPEVHMEGASLTGILTGVDGPRRPEEAVLPPDDAFSEALLRGPEQKSISAYPWKLIYDTSTEAEALFKLDVDPAEQRNLIDKEPEAKARLEDLLFKTLLDISDTWYVEMAGSTAGNSFDLRISTRSSAADGIEFFTFLDSRRSVIPENTVEPVETSRNHISAKGLEIHGPLTLAFKTNPQTAPVSFDLRIDGKAAEQHTYLGDSLTGLSEMPFTLARKTAKTAEGIPSGRPQPPYIVIWHPGGKFTSKNRIRLGDDLKKELRALGYTQ